MILNHSECQTGLSSYVLELSSSRFFVLFVCLYFNMFVSFNRLIAITMVMWRDMMIHQQHSAHAQVLGLSYHFKIISIEYNTSGIHFRPLVQGCSCCLTERCYPFNLLCPLFRGVILINYETYGLEPVPQSTTNEHILYLLKDIQTEPFVCGVANETSSTESHSHFDPGHSVTELLRVGMHIILY